MHLKRSLIKLFSSMSQQNLLQLSLYVIQMSKILQSNKESVLKY